MKKSTYFILCFVFFSILSSCSNKYEVEDYLFEEISTEFSNQGLDINTSLDTIESIFIREGLLKTIDPYGFQEFYQANIDSGMMLLPLDERVIDISQRTKIHHFNLDSMGVEKFGVEIFEASTFGRISNEIEQKTNVTGQITNGSVCQVFLDHMELDDFEHPFYRANVLLLLHGYFFVKHVDGQEYIRDIPKSIEVL